MAAPTPEQSAAKKARLEKWRNSPKGIETLLAYGRRREVKAARKASQVKYRASEKGRATLHAYYRSTETKAVHARYRRTLRGKLQGNKGTARRQDKWRAWLAEQKSGPCLDCGGTFPPECMDFDHVRGEKLFALSVAVINRERALAEIAKCDLVCANCHRIRTRSRRRASDVFIRRRAA